MALFLLGVAVLASTASPALAADRVKVLVLDIKSTDLSPSEVETLTSLITAHLGKTAALDVMSGADLRRLVDLEAAKQSAGCDQSQCLAELAGAMGAGLVVFGQAGKLGSTTVVTLNVFDAARNTAVGRESLTVRDLAELPAALPPAVDKLIDPLIVHLAIEKKPGDKQDGALSPKAKQVYDREAMRVCDDVEKVKNGNDKPSWAFCDGGGKMTENDFARRYQKLTGEQKYSIVDRVPDNHTISFSALGTGAGAVVLGGALAAANVATGGAFDQFAVPPDATLVGLTFAGVGVLAVGVGAVLFFTEIHDDDGVPADHSMSQSEGQRAIDAYNAALAEDVRADYPQ